MIFFKLAIIISLWTTVVFANCPISDNPKKITDCLRYLSSGLYGAAINDVKIICDVAVDVIRCAKEELGECVAAEIGRAALKEISSLAENCCPTTNHTKCPIRNGLFAGQRCFASDSFVTLADGKQKQIGELQSGDLVLAYNDQTKQVVSTPVITILHNQPTEFTIFKHLTTISDQQLSLTSNHLLLTDKNEYIMAKNIHAGTNIVIMNDKGVLVSETVVNVIDIVKQGYIAPLTQEGTIIVNNIAASCYATINNHRIAHVALAPMRWWYSWFGKEQHANEIIGLHWFPKMLYEITAFLMPSILYQ